MSLRDLADSGNAMLERAMFSAVVDTTGETTDGAEVERQLQLVRLACV